MKRYGLVIIMSLALLSLVGAFVTNSDAAASTGVCGMANNTDYPVTSSQLRAGACNNIMPISHARVIADMYDARHPGFWIYTTSWLSLRGNPLATSTTVPAGETTIPLQINTFTFTGNYGYSSAAGEEIYGALGKTHFSNASPTPPFLRGKTTLYGYAKSRNHFRTATPVNVDMPLDPTAYQDRTYIVDYQHKETMRFLRRSNDQVAHHECAVPATSSVIYTTSLDNIAPCPINNGRLSFTVRVSTNWTTSADSRVQFRRSGSSTYETPVGWVSGSNSGAVNTITRVPVNSYVRWQYRLRLAGSSFGQQFSFDMTNDRGTRFSPTPIPGFNASGQTRPSINVDTRTTPIIQSRTWSSLASGFSPFQITADMGGIAFCERIGWTPRASTGVTRFDRTVQRTLYNTCVQLEDFADIKARVTPESPIVLPGERPRFDFDVVNEGSAASPDARYEITYNQGVPGSEASCTRSGSLAGLERQTNWVDLPGCAFDTFSSEGLTNDNLCATLTIINPRPDVDRISESACVTIGKIPHVQVSGGDVLSRADAANSGIITTGYTIDGASYGSWAEYGLLAKGRINSASGGALAATTSPTQQQRLSLSFANTVVPPGNYGTLPDRADVTLPAMPTAPAGATVSIDSLANNRTHQRSSAITVSGGTTGRSFIIESQDSVTITGNIAYQSGSYSSLSALPQVIIKAPRIIIQEGVTRIDAWLLAQNSIVTCSRSFSASDPIAGLNSSICRSKLTVNGPLQSGQLYLRRTAGSEGSTQAQRRSPAEVLNLRSDAYLWAYGRASDSGVIRTQTIKSLPPRF